MISFWSLRRDALCHAVEILEKDRPDSRGELVLPKERQYVRRRGFVRGARSRANVTERITGDVADRETPHRRRRECEREPSARPSPEALPNGVRGRDVESCSKQKLVECSEV